VAESDETRARPPELPTTSHSPGGVSDFTHTADPQAALGTRAQTPEQAAGLTVSSAGETAVPGYAVLGELGRGGMGVVYRARDTRLNREVALKMILRADASRMTVARFWAEAEVMAAVKHPHVVQVYELGEADGRPFMAMEFVPGGSLEKRLKQGSLAPRAAAALVAKIAAGVGAAHEAGVVHRDLKPGNVLLTEDDSPKVTDFGIAKRKAHDLTQTQALMGTPAYMAPEQAASRAKFVGPQTDVWSLGVIL
jgi:eukaryotic-like serine/threonine-protein kinase